MLTATLEYDISHCWPEHNLHETELHLNSHTLALGVRVYMCLEGKHKLWIIKMAAWTVCLSQDNKSSSSQSHCSLLGFTLLWISSLLSLLVTTQCLSEVELMPKPGWLQEPLNYCQLFVVAIWWKRLGRKVGAFAEASCERCSLEGKAPVNKRVPLHSVRPSC